MLIGAMYRASGRRSRLHDRISTRAAIFVVGATSLSLWAGCLALVLALRHF
jgi:hypothetical protein